MIIVICLFFSLIIGVALSAWQTSLYRKIIIGKADRENRTPEYIDGQFYYIVPENEYLKLTAQACQCLGSGKMCGCPKCVDKYGPVAAGNIGKPNRSQVEYASPRQA
jgi:hypothetical protein